MKKVLSFVGCALFVAAMAISCKNNQEAATDTLAEDTTVMNAVEEVATADQMSDADHQAMLDAQDRCRQRRELHQEHPERELRCLRRQRGVQGCYGG